MVPNHATNNIYTCHITRACGYDNGKELGNTWVTKEITQIVGQISLLLEYELSERKPPRGHCFQI